MIDPDDIVIDAKSGVTGAGRAAKESSLFAEVSEGITAYGVAHHRHMPEIEQGLSRAAGTAGDDQLHAASDADESRHPVVDLCPHDGRRHDRGSAPRARGAPIADEPFVHVLPQGHYPATHHVRGSNLCLIGLGADRLSGRAIIVSAIDNLVKGASGQAVQDMNVMLGLPEVTGLQTEPLFP